MTVSNPTFGRRFPFGGLGRRELVGLLLVTVCHAGCAATRAAAVTGDLFEHHEVTTGNARHQTLLSGFFLGGDVAELVVVQAEETDDRRVEMYAFDGREWTSVLQAALGPEVLFVDAANIAGRDRLLTYERGRISWFDPDSLTRKALVELVTRYNPEPSGLHYGGFEPRQPFDEGEVPRIDITRDLNDDGRDDLVLPDVDGFWVAVQSDDGTFADAVKIGPAEPFRDAIAPNETRTYGEVGISPLTVPLYLSRLYQMDYDLDGRTDLVFWNQDHFDVHVQDETGRFSPVARALTTGVPFDSDGDYSNVFGVGNVNFFSLFFGVGKKKQRTVLRAVGDMNGDHVADLVTHSLEGRSVLRQRSRYEVYLGTVTPDGIAFSTEASTAARPRSKAGGLEAGGYSSLWLRDVDGDGQVDLLRGDVKIGIGAMVRALLGTSISMRAELFRMEDGAFPERATVRRSVTSDLSLTGGRDAGFFPAVLVGDVNGDGRSDVLVGKNRKELHVYLGVPGPELLARRPTVVPVVLPGDERNSWLANLNGDGKQDVLLHQPSIDEPHRVTMLIAR